jgi:DNA-directed RNA polymerase specialized sigma24 family protein
MSPLPLRRYRAERLLRQEFEARRGEVLAVVRRRLRAGGVRLDESDLEACYAQAWQGLYAALVAGREVANPLGWLTVVTFRRAIDEHRSRARASEPGAGVGVDADGTATEPDLAAELDDRVRLRQLFEALRGTLSARECEAASLCYLQGLTRAQAAARMGIGEPAMRKLMEGRGPGRPGVAAKVGELLRTIRAGGWCEQQSSLMRGLAFGILDPAGERYRLARLHQRECPACRAYVLSLRGLAAVLPPLPLPWGLGLAVAGHGAVAKAGAGAKTGAGAGAQVGTRTGAQAGRGAATTKAGAGAGAGTGAVSASGAAGAGGAAGGGWVLIGGSAGTKLAVSCLLALSIGCVAITAAPHRARGAHRHRTPRDLPVARAYGAEASVAATGSALRGGTLSAFSGRSPTIAVPRAKVALATAASRASMRQAQREFGLERSAGGTASAGSTTQASVGSTTQASVGSSTQAAPATARAASVGEASPARSISTSVSTQGGLPSQAEREFGPG